MLLLLVVVLFGDSAVHNTAVNAAQPRCAPEGSTIVDGHFRKQCLDGVIRHIGCIISPHNETQYPEMALNTTFDVPRGRNRSVRAVCEAWPDGRSFAFYYKGCTLRNQFFLADTVLRLPRGRAFHCQPNEFGELDIISLHSTNEFLVSNSGAPSTTIGTSQSTTTTTIPPILQSPTPAVDDSLAPMDISPDGARLRPLALPANQSRWMADEEFVKRRHQSTRRRTTTTTTTTAMPIPSESQKQDEILADLIRQETEEELSIATSALFARVHRKLGKSVAGFRRNGGDNNNDEAASSMDGFLRRSLTRRG